MENKRLEQEAAGRKSGTCGAANRDYRTDLERTKELYTVSPVFRKIKRTVKQPSPAQWREFSHRLSKELEATNTPLMQTLRDKITATDTHLVHWFWIVLALVILIALACAVFLSPNEPVTAIAGNLLPLLQPQIPICTWIS